MMGGLHVQLDGAPGRCSEVDEPKMSQPIGTTEELGTCIDGETTRQLEVQIDDCARAPVAPRANRNPSGREIAGLGCFPAS